MEEEYVKIAEDDGSGNDLVAAGAVWAALAMSQSASIQWLSRSR